MELNYHLICGSFKDFVGSLILKFAYCSMWEQNLPQKEY